MSLTTEQLERFVATLAGSPEQWRHLVRHSCDARVYEQIWDDDHVNAWVICWCEDQDTGFHDHDESGAAIAVISGAVREERLAIGSVALVRELGAGAVFTVAPTSIHRVLHAGAAPAVTIHAYSPPLERTGAYTIGPDGELQRESLPFEAELRGEPAMS